MRGWCFHRWHLGVRRASPSYCKGSIRCCPRWHLGTCKGTLGWVGVSRDAPSGVAEGATPDSVRWLVGRWCPASTTPSSKLGGDSAISSTGSSSNVAGCWKLTLAPHACLLQLAHQRVLLGRFGSQTILNRPQVDLGLWAENRLQIFHWPSGLDHS